MLLEMSNHSVIQSVDIEATLCILLAEQNTEFEVMRCGKENTVTLP